MQISGVTWLRKFVDKLASKHGAETKEVEEIFANRPRFRHVVKGDITGEDVYSAMGQTNSGRYLTVFFVCELDRQALVISARDMEPKERRNYGRK
jgi:uncharacterized protein